MLREKNGEFSEEKLLFQDPGNEKVDKSSW